MQAANRQATRVTAVVDTADASQAARVASELERTLGDAGLHDVTITVGEPQRRLFAHLWDGNNADVYVSREEITNALLEFYADEDEQEWSGRISEWLDEAEARPGEAVPVDGGMSRVRCLTVIDR